VYDSTLVQKSQYLTLDTYKYTRAAWFALFAPDAGRHDILSSDDAPDVYRRLFAAILEGKRGLARFALDDPQADLLDVVETFKAPRLIPVKRTDPDLPDYAAALFAHVADDDDAGLDIGAGDWPATPGHTCAAKEAVGTALILRPNETAAARMFNPTWRTCPACLHKRVKRIARQTLITITAAGAMRWAILSKEDYKRWTANIRQHRKRTGDDAHYRALPQEGGKVFVMSTHGIAGDLVPVDKGALYDLIRPYALTPDDKRASSSRGYGGDYKRLRGDGRTDKGIRLWTDARLEDVAGALGAEVKKGRNSLRVQIDQLEAFQRLVEAGIAMRARKGEGTAVQLLVAALEDVTLKVHSPEGEDLYLKRDDDDGGGDIAPQALPTLSDFDAGGGAPCPIYLP
jgi:hypothetical protein